MLLTQWLYRYTGDRSEWTAFYLPRWSFYNDESRFIPGGALLYKKFTSKGFWSLGLYYSQELFGPFYVPLIGWNYPLGKWQAYGNFPIEFGFNRILNAKHDVDLHIRTGSKSYYAGENTYIQIGEQALGMHWRYALKAPVYLLLRGGHSFGQSFYSVSENESYDYKVLLWSDKELEKTELDFSDGFFIELALQLEILP